MYLSILLIIVLSFLFLGIGFAGIKRIEEDEIGVIFRAGKFSRQIESGLTWIIPLLDTLEIVDGRLKSLDLGKQEFFSSDSRKMSLNVSVFYRVIDGNLALKKVEDLNSLLRQSGESVIKSVVASFDYDEILSNRQNVFSAAKSSLEKEAAEWGIDIDSFKIYDFHVESNGSKKTKDKAKSKDKKKSASSEIDDNEGDDEFLI